MSANNNMESEIKEIESISFGMMSSEDIRQMSSFEVKTAKISSTNLLETVHDPKSGPIGSAPCETCHQNEWDCPGHFGHIELNVSIIHPLFINHVVNILKIFCWKCNEFLLTKDHLELNNILKLEKEKKFNAVLEKIKKCDRCVHCTTPRADYKLVLNDITYKTIYRTFSYQGGAVKTARDKKLNESREIVSAEMVKKIFDNIKLEYVEMLGISHPKDFCLEVFPVIPSCCRPHEVQDGNINDDDLTYQLMEIVKNNSMIGAIKLEKESMEKQYPECLKVKEILLLSNVEKQKKEIDDFLKKPIKNGLKTKKKINKEEITPLDQYLKLHDKYVKYVNNLKFRIETYCNNSQGKATHATTGRAIKGLRERLTGKEGQIRNNLLGKRCEMSARTVIGPDPTLKIDEVVVPKEIAQSLTFPDFVNKHNIDRLTKLVNSGNAIRLVKKNESGQEIKINLAAAINNHGTPLQHDDIIKRPKITNNHEEKHNFDTFETIVIKDPKNFVLKEGDILFRNNFQQKVVYTFKKIY